MDFIKAFFGIVLSVVVVSAVYLCAALILFVALYGVMWAGVKVFNWLEKRNTLKREKEIAQEAICSWAQQPVIVQATRPASIWDAQL